MPEESAHPASQGGASIAPGRPHADSASACVPEPLAGGGASDGLDRTPDGVLALIADVERMLGTLKEEARQDLGRAGDAERLAAEVAALRTEADGLRGAVASLESELESRRGELAAGSELLAETGRSLAEREARIDRLEELLAASEASREAAEASCIEIDGRLHRSEEDRRGSENEIGSLANRLEASEHDRAALRARLAALEAELAGLANTLAEAIASRDAQIARLADDRNAMLGSHCRAQSDLAAAHAESDRMRAQVDALEAARAEAAAIAAARDDADDSTAMDEALASARDEIAARDSRIGELERELSESRGDRARSEVAYDAVSDEEIARAVEARIQQVLKPRLAQLAQVAQFLRSRRERLAALHRGLKRRARAQRALRQIYAQGAVQAPDAAPVASPAMTEDATRESQALADERRDLEELRTILAASERALARRAAGTRLVTTTALASAFLAVSAALSWHVAGVVAPTPALASIDLVVASRAPESQQGGTPDASGVAAWLESQLADERFTGVVAGRLGDLGRTNAESSALVAGLAGRMSVASDGPHVRLSLRADGADAASAALDAVATAAVAEANRLPERRSDLLRVAIANAGQEVGRAVFATVAHLPDPGRFARAGAIFGALTGVAALAAGVLLVAGRRAARLVAAQA